MAFREFVTDFGGEILPEAFTPSRSRADYYFRRYNVVAELKCLAQDQTEDTNKKLGEIVEQRLEASYSPTIASRQDRFYLSSEVPSGNGGAFVLNGVRSNGEIFALAVDDEFQRLWEKVLLSPVESIIRHANRQIRHTKEDLGIPCANGVVLIFNELNHLHKSPQHFGRLAGEVIQKPKDGERRFPHIQGMIYFSLPQTVTARDEQTGKDMPFWMPAQVAGESAEDVRQFQEDLKKGWFHYVEKVTGAPIRGHHRETGWPEPNQN